MSYVIGILSNLYFILIRNFFKAIKDDRYYKNFIFIFIPTLKPPSIAMTKLTIDPSSKYKKVKTAIFFIN